MSNGAQIFVNMRSYIYLIILLGLIEIVFCTHLANVSLDDETCPVTRYRRKRANMDYTRWRASRVTTPEFIVKVLDDDLPTSTPSVLAVNIMNMAPVTNRDENIIVGGAVVHQPVSTTVDSVREYTRFVPPTTVRKKDDGVGEFELFAPTHLAEVTEDSGILQGPSLKSVHRDESPPARPQFIQRAQNAPFPRQYAPIAPVAFARLSTHSPLTPPIADERAKIFALPTRTPTSSSPTRTVSPNIMEDLPLIQAFLEDDDNDMHVSRTTPEEIATRTSWNTEDTDPTLFDEDMLIPRTTIKPFKDMLVKAYEDLASGRREKERHQESQRKDSSKDLDNYNSIFLYNDEEKEIGSKKGLDYHEDDRHDIADVPVKDTESVSENQDLIDAGYAGDTNNTDSPYPEDTFTADNETDTTLLREIPPKSLDDNKQSRGKRRPICNMIKLRELNFNSPRTLPEIVAQMRQWTEDSPVAKWADITGGNLTTMENPIYVVIVDDPSVGQVASQKKNVLVVAGIHGRDHHAVAAAVYVLYQLIERSESHYDLLSKYRFWIIPVFNPDGYDYSMTFPQRREWMKNLRQSWDNCKGRESCKYCEAYGLRCTVSPCYGVNLDRNFEYQWIPPEELRAEHPCGNLYAGPRQLSEAETQALTNFLHRQKITISVFIAFKEGDILGVMYPYSHTKKKRAFDQIYRHRANRAAASAYSIAGRPYIAGQTAEFLPLYAGGIEDWADGHLGIDNTYTIMMFRPTDNAKSEYLTERVIHETYAAMDSLLLSSLDQAIPSVALTRSAAPKLQPHILTTLLSTLSGYLLSKICYTIFMCT